MVKKFNFNLYRLNIFPSESFFLLHLIYSSLSLNLQMTLVARNK